MSEREVSSDNDQMRALFVSYIEKACLGELSGEAAGLSSYRTRAVPKGASAASRRRRRKPGRRGPERFDADYVLRRLIKKERQFVLRSGGTDIEAKQVVEEIKGLSSDQLAERVAQTLRIRRSGRTYRRNSSLYAKWERQRTASEARPRGKEGSGTSQTSQQDMLGKAEIDAGNLSLSGPQSRRTKVKRDKQDRDADAMADDFLRQNGVDPHDMPAD